MNEKSKTAGNRCLYISDLDGTLLRNDATLSAYSRTKLIELLADGLNFTVASARSTYSLRHTLHGLAFKLPVIEINGAYISELASGRHIVVNDMSRDIAGEVYRRAVEHKCPPFIITFTGTDDRLYYDNSVNEGMDWYLDSRTKLTDPRLTQTDNLSEKFKEQVVAFTIINTYHALKDLAEGIKADLDDFLETHFFENPYSPPWW